METKSAETLSTLTEELENLAFEQPLASKGKRFVNLLIDEIILFLIFCEVNYFLTGIIEPIRIQERNSNHEGLSIFRFLFLLFCWWLVKFCYYFILERFNKGRTIGKLCTRTRAVIYENQPPLTTGKVLTRTLCRLIPLEIFSGFNIPWHDSITMTTVISTKTSK